MNTNDLVRLGYEKLAREDSALDNCRSDMSDVNFEIGKSSYTAKVFGMIVLFAVFFGGRIFLRRMIADAGYASSTGNTIFWILIGCIALLTIVTAVTQAKQPTVTVSGKTVFYNGNCWTSDEISCVKCTKWLERVEVYVNGKKVIVFPWELDNSEVFIAWTKKCGIVFDDNRIKRFETR